MKNMNNVISVFWYENNRGCEELRIIRQYYNRDEVWKTQIKWRTCATCSTSLTRNISNIGVAPQGYSTSTMKTLNLSQWRIQITNKLLSVNQRLIPLLVSCNYFWFHFGIIIICLLCSSVHCVYISPSKNFFQVKINVKLSPRIISLVLRNKLLRSGEILKRIMGRFWGIIGSCPSASRFRSSRLDHMRQCHRKFCR